MKNNLQEFDLTDPKACRQFLKTAQFGPKKAKITHLLQPDGHTRLLIDAAPDEQVMEKAQQIYDAFSRYKENDQ